MVKHILSWNNTIFGRNNEDVSNISPLLNKEKCQFTFKAPIPKDDCSLRKRWPPFTQAAATFFSGCNHLLDFEH